MKIGEFVIDLFVDAAKGELTIGNLVKSMGDLEVASVGEIAILTALADKLVEITQASMKSAVGFEEYAASTGASTDALQRWQAAGKMVGISNEAVADSLGMISQGLAGLPYGKATQLLNLMKPLDISLGELKSSTPEKLLERIRNSPLFQRMGEAEQRLVLGEAGLAKMQRVLMKGEHGVSDKEFAQFIRDAGTMSKGDIKQFERMHKDFLAIEALSTRIGQIVATWFSGSTIQFLEKEIDALRTIADYLEENKKKGKTLDMPRLTNTISEELHDLWEKANKDYKGTKFGTEGLRPHEDMLGEPVPPVSVPSPAAEQKTTTVHMTNNVNVPGSNDPAATAYAVHDRLTRLMVTSNIPTAVT